MQIVSDDGSDVKKGAALWLVTRRSSMSRELAQDLVSIVRSFMVVFRSAKDRKNATFAERKATLISRTMLTSSVELGATSLAKRQPNGLERLEQDIVAVRVGPGAGNEVECRVVRRGDLIRETTGFVRHVRGNEYAMAVV